MQKNYYSRSITTKKSLFLTVTLSLLIPALIDQVAKYCVRTAAYPSRIFFGFVEQQFGIDYHKNTGLVANIPLTYWVLLPVIFLCVGLLVYLLVQEIKNPRTPRETIIGLAFIVSGAISNLFDRVVFGFIIDYVRAGNAIFNFADVAIIAGAILVIFAGNKRKVPKL